MSHKDITELTDMVNTCHRIGSEVLLDYADYLLDRICYIRLSLNQEPLQHEWDGRKAWNEKYN